MQAEAKPQPAPLSVVQVGDEIPFTKIWKACVLKVLHLLYLYDVIFHL
jgi:hypothetical protein